MSYAIQARGLAKEYRIGHLHGGYDTLREHAIELGQRVLRRDFSRPPSNTIWALSGVDFDVEQGEVVGIIGRNGAGKTTLLRLLSRITEPTKGYADVRGRLGSLLEVGTGFHPELTGRENIFLNGAILGMRRQEIVRRFDEIVEFAGVERFLDTPVKRYSSGMYVRLAFSVAAHLEPEILIVDEVLAVGDAEFQRRCLGRMEEIGRSGRTVLFVSHNMQAVARLCSRSILLESGKVVCDAPTDDVIARYLQGASGTASEISWGDDGPGGDVARLRSVRVIDATGSTAHAVEVREPVGIEVSFDSFGADVAFVPWLAGDTRALHGSPAIFSMKAR
jgi:lipopolysaccharide transport system ATP-binding protein